MADNNENISSNIVDTMEMPIVTGKQIGRAHV